jgi:hypothetical protein
MKQSRRGVVISGAVLLLVPSLSVRAAAEESMLSYFSAGITMVFDLVTKWDQAIDGITSTQVKRQVRRRMERMNRDMTQLLREKNQMMRNLTHDPLPLDDLRDDLFEVRLATNRLKDSLVDVSGKLNVTVNPDVEKKLMKDLEAKSDFLDKLTFARPLTASQRNKAKANLMQAINKLTQAQNKLGECLLKL